jgi:large subunit ribosomal protein L30
MEQKEQKQRIAVVRVRGDVGLSSDIRMTLKLLRLYKKNCCTIVSNSPTFSSMLFKVKDFVTFGEISVETLFKLLKTRGRLPGNKPLTEDYVKVKLNTDLQTFCKDVIAFKRELKEIPGLKLFFKLKPPIGGFERGGIRRSYAEGGALGYRGPAINKLIEKML